MKLKFKLIPFIISTLIVVGVTFGICWYSYHDYEGNKIRFLEEHFSKEHETQELIENMVEMQFKKYAKGNDKISIIEDAGIEGTTYKDGTIHVPGYFDVDIYAVASENNNSFDYNYYFYLYNINYQNSTFNPVDYLNIVVVNGTGHAEEVVEGSELGLDLLEISLNKLIDDDTTNNPTTTYGAYAYYSYVGESSNSTPFPIYDSKATNYMEKEDDSTGPLVFRMRPNSDVNNNNLFVEEDNKITTGDISFAIVNFNEKKTAYTTLVTGQIKDVTSIRDLDYKEGYQSNPILSPSYGYVIGGRIALHGGIAFILSAVVAFLFYLIWMDPADNNKNTNKNKPRKKGR